MILLTPPKLTWLSASKLESYDKCPHEALAKEDRPDPPGKPMLLGRCRHQVIEVCADREWWPPSPEQVSQAMDIAIANDPEKNWASMVRADLSRIRNSIVKAAKDPSLWPALDRIVSIETRGIPAEFEQMLYGSMKWALPMDPNHPTRPWGLRGAFDLVFPSDDGADLLSRDWKSREGDYQTSGKVYCLAMAAIWPGYQRYGFQPYFLDGGRRGPLQIYTVPELMDAYREVEAKVDVVFDTRAARKGKRTPYQYCRNCRFSASCLPYKASMVSKKMEKGEESKG